MFFEELQKQLKEALNESRYQHTIGVMYTAGALAMAYGYDIDKAMLAGLLHDCAKCMTHEERIDLCNQYGVEIRPSEYEIRSLLHAKAGAILAKERYGIEDEEVLHAIAIHTTGMPDMSLLDKIVYIADYIEPNRRRDPDVEYVRRLAFRNLDECMAQILYDTLEYLNKNEYAIDSVTALAYDYYKKFRKEK